MRSANFWLCAPAVLSLISGPAAAAELSAACEPSFTEAIFCLDAATAAKNSVTFRRNADAIDRFRLPLAQQGCGTASTLSRAPGESIKAAGAASVATPTGVVDVLYVHWTTRDGRDLFAWVARDYLPPSCAAPSRPADNPPQAPRKIQAPNWRRTPSLDDLARYRPAGTEQLIGRANLSCRAGARGELTGCVVRSETPPARGFGAAAINASQLYRLAPSPGNEGAEVDVEVKFPPN